MNLIKLSTDSLALKPDGEGEITITNTARGPYNLAVEEKPAGVEATLERTLLLGGEKTVLKVKAGEGAKSGAISLRVVQSSEVLRIEISVK